ncbi:MAG: hypothetical protein JEY94_09015 [Melioribacteraceae bacterium]|nr:hypothetical protein [Melioribacteraceae bacterium]
MKKLIILIFLLSVTSVKSQWDISAGMGINQVNASSFREYINVIRNGDLNDFFTAADFFGTVNYSVSEDYQVGIEIGYSIYSYNTDFITGKYDISLGVLRPSVLLLYVITGEGYKLKLGGGVGIRLFNVNEKIPPIDQDFSTLGFGVLLKAEGYTKLSDNLYAVIGFDTRLDFTGDLENDDLTLYNSVDRENVTVGSFSVGIKLGVSYYF